MQVKKVGIEIEGAFKKRFEDVEIIHDGSICTKLPEGVGKKWHLGEVVSEPLPPEGVEGWIMAHYPDAMNALCGLHVHVSFDENERGVMLCSYGRFYKFFLEEMEKWGHSEVLPPEHEFWTRLSGKNEYCKKAFIPSIQARRRGKEGTPHLPVKGGGDRYCQLNFSYKLHGTIEARLLPTFEDVGVAISGVQHIIGIFNEWVARPREEDVKRLLVTIKEGRRPRVYREPQKKLPQEAKVPKGGLSYESLMQHMAQESASLGSMYQQMAQGYSPMGPPVIPPLTAPSFQGQLISWNLEMYGDNLDIAG